MTLDNGKGVRGGVEACRGCGLHQTCTRPVRGEGPTDAGIVVIGEAPGRDEDQAGRPFVGKAGKNLDQFMKEAGLAREAVYITNIVKCRPPNNRPPQRNEAAACRKFLEQEIREVAPAVILTVGLTAAQRLLDTTESLAVLRGRHHYFGTTPVIVTYHTSSLSINRVPGRRGDIVADIMAAIRLGMQTERKERT